MKKLITIFFTLILIALISPSCKKDYGDLNGPTVEDFLKNAAKDQLNNLVSGTESAMRINLGLYIDNVSVIGREGYRFSGSEPRFVTDLLGAANATLSNNSFYINNTWASLYRVVKNCNVLIEAAGNSTFASAEEKKAYQGFAKTNKAYALLLVSNLTYSNGIRVDVANPNQPGPILGYNESLQAIAAILDEAKADLSGAQVSFNLSSGFTGFNNAAGLLSFNRALAARVAVYRKQWIEALTYLNESFFDLNGDLDNGVYHLFSTGPGDQLNPLFFPPNQAGEVRAAHPSYAADITGGDTRISKTLVRTNPATMNGLTGNRDVWVYTSVTDPVPLIRNEELILIYAEAKIQNNQFPDALVALNTIRDKHNAGTYGGAVTKDALISDLLRQRRFSLFYEGHRWVDLRRYEKLNELPVDRAEDDVWTAFPLPRTEQ